MYLGVVKEVVRYNRLMAEYDGILRIGEVPVVIRRDRVVESDHAQAYRSGAVAALTDVAAYVTRCLAAAGPYDDTRSLLDLQMYLADRIRGTEMMEV